ncbi:ATP-binding protein [Streptomyces bikiniensis]|uniref:ATP-binding protein n=1 Tax=Streptomyces bikiniensis TaxID=1896 RepID=UPI0004C17799|nr:ATP-binding protein [Streptomyces bikiniensis]
MEAVPVGEDGAAPDEQVMRSTTALHGDDSDISRARRLAGGFLTRARTEYGLLVSQRAIDLAQLVVSELVTNARKYAPGPAALDLRIVGGMVEIGVWDCDPVLPVARAADAGRVGQHGLEIVVAVAHSFEARREPVGKRITVLLTLADETSRAPTGRWPLENGQI